MNRTFDILYICFLSMMVILLSVIAWDAFSESSWKERCKGAGGFPASHYVCVNPSAVIEVD